MSQASGPTTLANVQVLRAFAALNVAGVHILEQAAKYDQDVALFAFLQNWGDSGVDLFFVISGFIMVYIQRRRPSGPGRFLDHRIYRVVPLYWTLTLLYVGLWLTVPGLFGHAAIDVPRLLRSLSFTTLFVEGAFPVLYLGWILEYEMIFYLAFTLAIFAGDVRHAVLVCSGLIIAGFLWLPLEAVVCEFLFGAGLGLVYDRPWPRRRGAMLLAVGAVALLATLVDPWHALEHRWFFWGIPALLLVAGAVTVPQLRHRGLHFLGDASYSLYLIQVFTISAYYKLAVALPVDLPNDVDAVLCMAFTIVAGIGTYLVAEKPLIDLRTARRRRGSPATAAGARAPSAGRPAAVVDPHRHQPSLQPGGLRMLIAQLFSRKALAALAGTAVLAAGVSLSNDGTDAPATAASRPAAADCDGGRGQCGDRSGDSDISIVTTDRTSLASAHCRGGRRSCGDRAATEPAVTVAPRPTTGPAAIHPRALAR